MRQFCNRRYILNRSKEVRRLDDHASRFTCDRRIQSGHIYTPVRRVANLADGNLLVLRVRRNDFAILRMHRSSDDSFVAAGDTDGHHHRLGRACRPVIHEALAISMPVSSQIIVWNSNIACSVPCDISGWYGV